MIRYRNELITKQRFAIGIDSDVSTWVFARCKIDDCVFDMQNPSLVLNICSNFNKTYFYSGSMAANLFWPGCSFCACVFKGTYYDTRFGIAGSAEDKCLNDSGLKDCDFSGATLHLCSFFNCDPSTIKFPKWPHITVLYPKKNSSDWLSISFPEKFRILQKIVTYNQDKKAATIHWPTYAREENDTTDPELIRQLLVGKDYIVM